MSLLLLCQEKDVSSRDCFLFQPIDSISRVKLTCPVSLAVFQVALFSTCSELHKVLFLALCVTFLFVYEISWELLSGFAPDSQGRHVWSLARTSLNLKVKGKGHHGQNGIFRSFQWPACSLCLVKHLQPLVYRSVWLSGSTWVSVDDATQRRSQLVLAWVKKHLVSKPPQYVTSQPGAVSTGDGFGHCWRRNVKFCITVGHVIRTTCILIQFVKGAVC